MIRNILITGGLGFIGSNFIRRIINNNNFNNIINIDKKTYSANNFNLKNISNNTYKFIKGDINSKKLIKHTLKEYKINIVVNFAAESHVDRSILNPGDFIKTNINGTFNLLSEFKNYVDKNYKFSDVKFIQISTDEVFGSLSKNSKKFNENSPYLPNNPYSASKAASDMIARSFYKTYDFPIYITNCTNNYGPFQHPEKIIPLTIQKCINKEKIPIYGNGKQIRDWIHVDDHCDGIIKIIDKGKKGESYNIGSNNEITNLDLVKKICQTFQKIDKSNFDYKNLISFVADRPGHDKRYSIDSSKISKSLGWQPKIRFSEGLHETIKWYINNPGWLGLKNTKNYQKWLEKNYANRELL